ncbi:hypothetical protein EEL32_09805 [Brevibacillus laterosporus]|nr:hypothetical protein [Brevibacillus laterosporus]TPG88431.1 hypothetical protein EEL32_09805 [Brevibacillus laterosporus]
MESNIFNEDHAFPRGKLIEKLLSLSKEDLTEEYLWDFFVNYNVGVHLLKKEHDNLKDDMPTSFSTTDNIWSRYKEENFEIIRVTWQERKVIYAETIKKNDPSVRPSLVPYYEDCKEIF